MYQIPADVKEKEKVIGGVLTLIQFFWILGGLVFGLLLLVLVLGITGSLIAGAFFLLLGLIASLPFAFYTKKNMPLFKYLKLKRKLKKKTVVLVNRRKDVKKWYL